MRARPLMAWSLVAVLACSLIAVHAGEKRIEPDVVVVQHILIAFKKSVPGKKIDRTKREAQALAEKLLERARGEEDFDALVREYTDDSHPGIYRLTNRGAPLMAKSRTRDQMVSRFGDVAFSLEVGEVGMAKYHGGASPYGWHVIKRLE